MLINYLYNKGFHLARPKRLRRLAFAPPAHFFLPAGEEGYPAQKEIVVLSMDEFEALRLADLECLSQEDAAKKMGISRPTFGRIIESARSKVARALVEGCRIEITGGSFKFGRGKHLQCPRCRRRQSRDLDEREHVDCRRCCQPLQNSDKSQQEKSH
jgi:predicted DNA-binding protein (UPF0251 family)